MMGMPSCREVTLKIAAGSLAEASARQRLGIRLHVMMCRHCRRYARQMRAIGLAARELLARNGHERESLQRLRQELLARIDSPDA